MRRFLALTLVVAMIGLALPMPAGAAAAGQISGTAIASDMQALRSCNVRLRSLATGMVRDVVNLTAQGTFTFNGLNTGSYLVEVVNNGRVVGTSGEISITPRSPVVGGVSVMARGAQNNATGGGGSFWTSTAGVVLLVAAGAGITAGVIVARGDASPSR